jgi:type 1 fimbria pilin
LRPAWRSGGGPAVKPLSVSLLAIAALAAAPPGKQTFTGVITDSMCATADHSQMKMGPTDGECAIACIDVHGAAYVLYDGKRALTLSDQKTPEKFAGKKVTVTGTLDVKAGTIRVDSITAAK